MKLDDESKLETITRYSTSTRGWIIIILAVLFLAMVMGGAMVSFTPVKRLLPGYMQPSQRAETELYMLRLDSLRQAYEANSSFLSNFMNVIEDRPTVPDTAQMKIISMTQPTDSILPATKEERKFMEMMKEREKYNISVVAPLAAESLMFSPLSSDCIFSSSSRDKTKGEVIVARGSSVYAVADGTVIAVIQSVKDGGVSVIIQHPKGFLSRINRLGQLLVGVGDAVTGGQAIALTAKGNGKKSEVISIEMWHDGNSLVPYEYIGGDNEIPRFPILDEDVGRGRI